MELEKQEMILRFKVNSLKTELEKSQIKNADLTSNFKSQLDDLNSKLEKSEEKNLNLKLWFLQIIRENLKSDDAERFIQFLKTNPNFN